PPAPCPRITRRDRDARGRVILAHAFGTRYDLPVPLWLFVAGGALVVLASFLLVLPRAVSAAPDGGAETAAAPRRGGVAGAAGLLALVAMVVCGIAGTDEVAENIVPTLFWLVLWIAVPVSCGLLGDWTGGLNPFAAVARLADRDGARRVLIAGGTLTWP